VLIPADGGVVTEGLLGQAPLGQLERRPEGQEQVLVHPEQLGQLELEQRLRLVHHRGLPAGAAAYRGVEARLQA
jgi:hypothetical protein